MANRSASFTVEEDIQLCHAYLDISQNAIIGINQSGDTFWKRVQTEYEKSHVGRTHQKRQGRSLACRMSTILTACAKFRGCINQIQNQNPSGASDQDMISMAKVLLTQDPKYKKGFKFDHVWDLLKDTEKFTNTQSSRTPTPHAQSSPSAAMYSPSSLQDESSPTPDESSPTPMNISERPIGVKKAKRNQQNDEQFKKLMDQNDKLIKVISKGTAERNEIQRQKVEVRRLREENKIIFADLSSCVDPAYKAFIEEERAKIMRKRRGESQNAEHGEGSGSQYRAYQASRAENDEEEHNEGQETQGDPQTQGDYSPYFNYLSGNDTNFPGF